MRSLPLETAVRRIRALTGPDGPSDPELLTRFRTAGDQRAFAALVARHGPAVLGVCRRVLHDPHAAEDAFQAAFLVLARRAGAVRNPAALGAWLHGVAVRVATRLRGRLARQPQPATLPELPAEPRDDVLWRDVRRVLDEELNRLPDRLRLAVYLCYFEGKTRDEAAEALGWKLSTLRGRLEDGRQRLRSRLALRGVELSAALLAVSAGADGLAVGEPLIEAAVRAAGGSAPETVRSLARAIAMSGVAGKATVAAGVLLLAVGLGTGLLAYRGEAGQPPAPAPAPKAPEPAEPPAKEKALPTDLLALMTAADRVWVVDEPTDRTPVPEPVEVLKGSLPLDPGYSFRFNVEALKELPRKGHRWVVFLRAVDEVDHIPKITPLPGDRWYVPADDATVAALREYVPPCAWGEASNGLRLGLWPRPGADEPTVEVVLQNVDKTDLTIQQFRGNYFDEWPHLTFAVTKKYTVQRQGGPHKDSDAPTDRLLKAGARYIHVVRLARWLTAPDRGTAGNAPPGLFAAGGDFQVQATFSQTSGPKLPGWWRGTIESKPITVTVPPAAAYGGEFGGFRLRLNNPAGPLRTGDRPDLVCDLKYEGKDKRAVFTLPENATVELDGLWYTCHLDGYFAGRTVDVAPASEHPGWLTVRPDAQWVHLRDKPGAADPAVKDAVPFRLAAGKHTLRVAYSLSRGVRALSNPVTVEVASDGWGEPAGGVRARLRLPNTKPRAGDALPFELDLKNVGPKAWTIPGVPFDCRVFLDDVPYTHVGPLDYKATVRELKPGGELVPFVTGTVDNVWASTPTNDGEEAVKRISVLFRLSPGRHRVRVEYPLSGDKVRPVSNEVDIEVAAPELSGPLWALARGADRIWVVPAPTREKPIPTPEQVLKGPPADRPSVFDLRLLPGDDPTKKFLVFLRADEEKPVPEVKPVPSSWHVPYDPGTADAIRQAILPAEWGPELNGLRMGLRLRNAEVAAGGKVEAEVTIRNVGSKDQTIPQHRLNIYDYWARTRFEVTGPDGSAFVLGKPAGKMTEEDSPRPITLKPGDAYTHVVRLDRWPAYTARPKAEEPAPRLFAGPGKLTLTARYALTPVGGEASWTAGLASAPVTLTVTDRAGRADEWGPESGGVQARLRLAKAKFKAGEPLNFELDLRNTGTESYTTGRLPRECEIELDGAVYTFSGVVIDDAPVARLEPGLTFNPFVAVTADENWVDPKPKPEGKPIPLRLTAGKHTIRVSYPLGGKAKPTSPEVAFEVTAE